jgi:hypothetical protein
MESGTDIMETLVQLRDFADTLLQLRAKATAAAGGDSGMTTACAAAGTSLLLRARELERQEMVKTQELRDQSAAQRSKLDLDAVQLHNLVYEQQYYDKEILSCRAFRSAVHEAQVCSAEPPQQQHDQELARLTAELQQRKELKAQLHALEGHRQAAHERRSAAQAAVDDLRSQISNLSKHSKPVMEITLPSAAAIQDNREAAQLLPLPLYIIYSQAATAASIIELPLRVFIEGSVAAAQQEAAAQQHQQAGAAGPAPVLAQDAKRRRKSMQQDDATYKVGQVAAIAVRFSGGPKKAACYASEWGAAGSRASCCVACARGWSCSTDAHACCRAGCA